MPTELEFLKSLEEDVQRLRTHTSKARYEYAGFAVTPDNLATSLKVKISGRISEIEQDSKET